MRYQVVTASDPVRLAAAVEKLLAAGWRCQGSVTISQDLDALVYGQAMVKD